MASNLSILLLYFLIVLSSANLFVHAQFVCNFYNTTNVPKWTQDVSECDSYNQDGLFQNIQLIKGVYCFNDGTGLCKAFAGRFEFYFNTNTDEFIGPVKESEYVDKFGYHQRVPVSYNTEGNILFADRAINWAKNYYGDGSRSFNLLNSSQFNWCQFTLNDNWPYTSSINDPTSNYRYKIYFFNRQTCIFDKQTGKRQHYNTRFVYKTQVRIEQEMNPLIFVFEDKIATEGPYRMVKNKRQHWYEVEYIIWTNVKPGVDYFLKMNAKETKPCKICNNNGYSNGILTKKAFRNHTNLCLSDNVFKRDYTGDNNFLLTNWCGFDEVELADLNTVQNNITSGVVYEADLHNLPKNPKVAESFFGVNYGKNDGGWIAVAANGLAFSAVTTIPISSDKVRVIMLWALFKPDNEITDEYDEHYPLPHIGDYEAIYKKGQWDVSARKRNSKEVRNLNYVDDIAYLYKCKTILLILGPLYSEWPETEFNLDYQKTVLPIDKLGLYEMTNAFFADPNEGQDKLYFYHRTNFVATHQYSCGSNANSLVTAKRVSVYQSRHGPDKPPIFRYSHNDQYKNSEELFYHSIGVFKGSIDSPEAPDPALFPYTDTELIEAPTSKTSIIYGMVGSALLIILIMCIICCLTLRRKRHKNRGGIDEPGDDNLSSLPTKRSSYNPSNASGISGAHTLRSRMTSPSSTKPSPKSMRSSATTRSSLSNLPSKSSSQRKRSTMNTVRSRSLSRPKNSYNNTQSSSPNNSKTTRSSAITSLSPSFKTTKVSSTNSHL